MIKYQNTKNIIVHEYIYSHLYFPIQKLSIVIFKKLSISLLEAIAEYAFF